jgi:GDP-mannose 6-dehydrogenase
MRISVFGMGYVGAVSAACFAELGHEVTGVDVSPRKVEMLNRGQSPVVEEGLDAAVQAAVSTGRLRATADAGATVLQSDVSLISVSTPISHTGAAVKHKNGPHAVVLRSTVPAGATEGRVLPDLQRHSGRARDDGLAVAFNPEFLREGCSLKDFRLSNAFHAVKITFANEAGVLLKTLGVDTQEAMRIFCEDRQLNNSPAYLRPGFAFGGSCLPKDVAALVALAKARHVDLPFLANLANANDAHIDRALEAILAEGRCKVALLGLAFKAGTDDLRHSPNVYLAERLIGKGYDLAIYDRNVHAAKLLGKNREFIEREIPHFDRLLVEDLGAALKGAGMIVIGHASAADIDAIAAHHDGRPVFDLQGLVRLRDLPGLHYISLC